jgi:hypothetical protein
MAIKTFTTGEVLTAADTNTYLANSGLTYVASKTFTSTASAQQIDNCFTSTYDNYFITYYGVGAGANADYFLFRLVDGTSPVSTAIYLNSLSYSGTAAMTSFFQGAQTSWKVGLNGDTACSLNLSVFNPQVADKTTSTSSFMVSSTNNFFNGQGGALVNNTTQYEGFQLFPTSGNFSGTITVYGYRKA